MPSNSSNIKDIFILVTNKCNLNCKYCYESSKNNDTIDVELLKPILKREIEIAFKSYEFVRIVYHGGEPFLAFQRMQQLSDWIWENFDDNKMICSVTTNGTVLDQSIKSWLVTNKTRFLPTLSLDGGKHANDLNRYNSFDKIDKDFFITNWPNIPVKMTVCPNTIGEMFNNILDLYSLGFDVNPTLAREVEWDADRDIPLFLREQTKLTNYFIENNDKSPSYNVALELERFSPELGAPKHRNCGAGKNMMAFDANSKKYPCHTFVSDFSKEYPKKEIDEAFELLNDSQKVISQKCSECFFSYACTPCYGLNFSNRGNMESFEPITCKITQVRVFCAAKMYLKMFKDIEKYPFLKAKSSSKKHHLAYGVKAVINHFQQI